MNEEKQKWVKQIKEYREAQGKVFEINQKIIALRNKEEHLVIIKNYYTVVFIKRWGENFNLKLEKIKKEILKKEKVRIEK